MAALVEQFSLSLAQSGRSFGKQLVQGGQGLTADAAGHRCTQAVSLLGGVHSFT